MAQIVLGVGASHSTLMNTHWEETTHREEAITFRDGLAEARRRVEAARPDVALIIGSNHFRGFWLDLIPGFTLGLGECLASGESGTPKGRQPVHTGLARHIVDDVVGSGRGDLAFSARMQIDHGQSHAIQYLLAGLEVPIIPLVVNVFARPLPPLARCREVAEAIRAAVASYPEDLRVVVIGSGGLSHRLPWPDWRAPEGDDEEFMVRAWLDGRLNWSDYDVRRRQIIRAATSAITPEWDEAVIDTFVAGRTAELYAYSTEDLEREAGNGSQELRSWLMMATLLGGAPAERIAYAAVPDWLTGMGVISITPAAAPARA